MMKHLLSTIVFLLGFSTLMGCGPSKAEIEAQRRADSARIVDSVLAIERQRVADSLRIADSIQTADSIAQANLLKQIESTYNITNDWEDGAKVIISRYGTARLKSTYAKFGSSSGIEACYLLKVDYTDGYMTIKGKSVNRINDNSCQLIYKTYYNGPEDVVEDYGTATLTMVRENGTWLIDDIEEDGYNTSFMKDPKAYRHYAP